MSKLSIFWRQHSMLSLFVVIHLSFDTKKESGYYVWKTRKTILFLYFPKSGGEFH
ncbi:Uncharacterised protein [Actinobacillus pleuropneumoniae]|nr:Uncharacterised protein [Actinobacillus pleuropneumoniae]